MSNETQKPGQPQDVNDKSNDPSRQNNPNPAQGQHRPNDPSQDRKGNEYDTDKSSDKRKAS